MHLFIAYATAPMASGYDEGLCLHLILKKKKKATTAIGAFENMFINPMLCL